jgi:hypothetical protein
MFRFRRAGVGSDLAAWAIRARLGPSGRRAVHRINEGARRFGKSGARASPSGRSSTGLGFADCPLRRGDSKSKPVACSTSPDSEHQPAERREPERSEVEPNHRRTNSLHHGCFYSGRIARQTRAEFSPSKPSRHRGFESTPLRHRVLLHLQFGER